MQIAPEPDQGAARQHWRAASCILAVAGAGLVAALAAPGGGRLFSLSADIALGVAGYAATRSLLAAPDGAAGWGRALARMLLAVAPALIVVMLAVLLAGVGLLPPMDLRDQAWTVLATAVMDSGGDLVKQGAWAPEFSGDLLLHGWVIGAATQLALGWSVVVLLTRRMGLGRWLGGLAIGGAVFAGLLNIQLLRQGFDIQAFYLSPPRAWGFLLGAAFATIRQPAWLQPPPALAPVLDRWASLGRLALPIFLWAWPLLALPRMILARPASPLELAASLGGAVLLALATRRWIERPIQARFAQSALAGATACLCGLAATGAVAVLIYLSGGLPGRASAAVLAEEAGARRLPPMQALCHSESAAVPDAQACTIPAAERPDVVLWGNSHASHLSPAVLDWTTGRGLALRQATRSGCLPFLRDGTCLTKGSCVAFNRAALAEWAEVKPAMLILGAGWTAILERSAGTEEGRLEVMETELLHTLKALRAAVGPSTRIILLADTPDYAFAPAECRARRMFLGLGPERCDVARPANARFAARVERRLAAIAASEPGVSLFRPSDALCAGQLCRTRGLDGPWYTNRNHLTEAGGRAQTRALAVVLDAAIASE